jgi:hypothetical protein
VTTSDLQNTAYEPRLIAAAKEIHRIAQSSGIILPSTTELFLELDDNDETSCGYYLIHHHHQTQFWVHEVASEHFPTLPPLRSHNHLRTSSTLSTTSSFQECALENLMRLHYWNHVDIFPAHIPYLREAGVQLISILSQHVIGTAVLDFFLMFDVNIHLRVRACPATLSR